MPRLLLLCLLLCGALTTYSQDFSNKGKEFFIAYPAHIDGTNSVMGIYITSNVNTTGIIQVGPTATVPFTVTANQVTSKFIGSLGSMDASNNYVYLGQSDGIKSNAAIRIISEKPVVAYTHIIRSARSGATLALPTTVMGTEYIAPSFANYGSSDGYGQIAVVATQPGTIVEITPAINGRNGRQAKVPFQVTLPNAGDVYQFQGILNGDISGTRIKSIAAGGVGGCKPIAVFSATTWSGFDCTGAAGGDNLYQQLFPLRSWGKKFITAPFINRPYDIYKVFVDDPTTVVTAFIRGVPFSLDASNYNANGKFYTLKTPYPIYVEADKPISVVQYMISQTCKTGCGTGNNSSSTCVADPEMVVLNPVEQTLNDITFFSAHQRYVPQGQTQVTQHYVNVIISKAFKGTVKIDNAPVPAYMFVDIIGSNFSYLQFDLTNSSYNNPVHRITADTSFSAIVYGYGNVESYGYNGGTNVIDRYQYVTLQNQYASVNFPATCVNTPFNFSITLPYQATSLKWDFNNQPGLSPNSPVVINNPVPDSSYVLDDRTLYVYRLPGNYKYSAVGTYNIKVLANNPSPDGCNGVQEINYDVEVYNPHQADFSITHTGCSTDTLYFADYSNGNGRPVVLWNWSFGDGTQDSAKLPKKLYGSAGSFPVLLRTITDIGCVADTVKTVTFSSKPVANFTIAGTRCPGSAISFTNTSSIAVGSIVKWHWDFANGKTYSNTNAAVPPQVYDTAGSYLVSLIVESNSGCSTQVVQSLEIFPNPVVDFNLPGVCLPSGIANFQNLTHITGGNAAYLWNFGDGKTDTVSHPVHIYQTPGPFEIKLQATSSHGCTADTTKRYANIFAQTKTSFSSSAIEICLGDSFTFTDASTPQGSPIAFWHWSFGDGTTSNEQHPVIKFAAPGIYQVSLYSITVGGCYSDTVTKQVTVHALPQAAFTFQQPLCENQPVTFMNTSVANAGDIASANWNFGDGTTLTTGSQNIEHAFSIGSHTISLAVTNSKGCKSDTATRQAVVNPLPVPVILLPMVCLGDAYAQFGDSSYMSDGSASSLQYAWNFGDPNASAGNPNTSTTKDPRHKYTATGVYDVMLKVIAANGCADTLTVPFTVNGAVPKAGFGIVDENRLCANQPVRIRNTSTVDFGKITRVEVLWDELNDPSLVMVDDAPLPGKVYMHQYPVIQQTRSYQVLMRSYSGSSCVDSKSMPVTVKGSPAIVFPPIGEFCLDNTVYQIPAPANGNFQGSGIYSGRGVSPSGLFSAANAGAGMHNIKYVFTNTNGCSDSAVSVAVVHPNPLVNAGADKLVLEGDSVMLQPRVTGNDLSFAWSPATYLTNPAVLNPVATPLADVNYRLTVTGRGGCTGVDEVTVKVLKALRIPNIFSPNGDGINDLWVIQHLEVYPGATVEIYDRYGSQLLMNYQYKPWDGTIKGKPLPVGTYYYIINPKNGRNKYTGAVTIIR